MSPRSHTSHLRPAAGRGVREAAGHGAAPLLPARFGCPDGGTARGTRRGTTHHGRAGAAAGYEAPALDEIAKGSDSLPAPGCFDGEKKP